MCFQLISFPNRMCHHQGMISHSEVQMKGVARAPLGHSAGLSFTWLSTQGLCRLDFAASPNSHDPELQHTRLPSHLPNSPRFSSFAHSVLFFALCLSGEILLVTQGPIQMSPFLPPFYSIISLSLCSSPCPTMHDLFSSVSPMQPHSFSWSQRIASVQFSHSVMSDSLRPHGLQHASPPCASPTPRVYSNSCPLSQ